jgi:hypothetical protein
MINMSTADDGSRVNAFTPDGAARPAVSLSLWPLAFIAVQSRIAKQDLRSGRILTWRCSIACFDASPLLPLRSHSKGWNQAIFTFRIRRRCKQYQGAACLAI